ncbi:class I SAM-dependent methyltransferase [Altererythrobacter sp. CC-YST694]|uniref:O-methyltransferase n=1 Tax=Altererythrobacter sp. CC-YST694 TaxID=2755038 RepID=UPI001D02D94B|nr:class I SAM-dependent methyltransferase [Altererythrobacter sp. CC-YST694]MCB5426041.1 class I SAM-dependent methyltransferase [Altererythrobacter sp. CC-YST694]
MHFKDPKVAAVFAEYADRQVREAATTATIPAEEMGARRNEFLLPVGAEAAGFLHSLVIARAPETILELGTSYGYSTLFLADAARECGARLITVDLDPAKQAYASAMLTRAGLEQFVEFRCGDALEVVSADPGPFDFVFLDIWKNLYVPCFEAVYPRLSDEAIMATDNMILPEGARDSARALRRVIREKPDLQTTLLPVGQGIELTVRWAAGNSSL